MIQPNLATLTELCLGSGSASKVQTGAGGMGQQKPMVDCLQFKDAQSIEIRQRTKSL